MIQKRAKTSTKQSDLGRCSSSPKSKDKRKNLTDTSVIPVISKETGYWIRLVPDSSETQVPRKTLRPSLVKDTFIMTLFPACENSEEKLVITISQKGTTELLLLSFLSCSFWLFSLPVSLAGDFGANTWLCSPLCSLSSELLLHQKRIPLLSLSQVLMAQSEKNKCENQKVTLRITCNCPFLKGLVSGYSGAEWPYRSWLLWFVLPTQSASISEHQTLLQHKYFWQWKNKTNLFYKDQAFHLSPCRKN